MWLLVAGRGLCWGASGGGIVGWSSLVRSGGQQMAAMWRCAAVRSLAVGQPSMIVMMVRPAECTIRAGVCHKVQRNRFGSAVLSGPVQHSCWNQRTRLSLVHTSCSQARLASRSLNENRSSLESLSRLMWSSTCA